MPGKYKSLPSLLLLLSYPRLAPGGAGDSGSLMSLLRADPSGGKAGERDRLNLPCLESLACRQQSDLGAPAVEV